MVLILYTNISTMHIIISKLFVAIVKVCVRECNRLKVRVYMRIKENYRSKSYIETFKLLIYVD